MGTPSATLGTTAISGSGPNACQIVVTNSVASDNGAVVLAYGLEIIACPSGTCAPVHGSPGVFGSNDAPSSGTIPVAYNSGTTYAVGAQVGFQGLVYQRRSAAGYHAGIAPSNATYWTRVTVVSSRGFTDTIGGLAAGTRYAIRAYALDAITNNYGHSAEFDFTTPNIPTCNDTATGTAPSYHDATMHGQIASNGGGTTPAAISEFGFLLSTSPNPTIGTNGVPNGNAIKHVMGGSAQIGGVFPYPGVGQFFTWDPTNLTPSTQYFWIVYAINSIGVGYSNGHSFTTLAAPSCTLSSAAQPGGFSPEIVAFGQINTLGGGTLTDVGFLADPTQGNVQVATAARDFRVRPFPPALQPMQVTIGDGNPDGTGAPNPPLPQPPGGVQTWWVRLYIIVDGTIFYSGAAIPVVVHFPLIVQATFNMELGMKGAAAVLTNEVDIIGYCDAMWDADLDWDADLVWDADAIPTCFQPTYSLIDIETMDFVTITEVSTQTALAVEIDFTAEFSFLNGALLGNRPFTRATSQRGAEPRSRQPNYQLRPVIHMVASGIPKSGGKPPAELVSPSNLVAIPSPTAVKLKWSEQSSLLNISFRIEQFISGNWVSVGTTGAHTFTIDGLEPTTNYAFRVTAVHGTSTSTPTGVFVRTLALSAPTGLDAVRMRTGIYLSWTPDSDSGIASYNVYRGAPGSSVGSTILVPFNVGDPNGITDSTLALQSWFEANVSSGGGLGSRTRVIFPPNATYLVEGGPFHGLVVHDLDDVIFDGQNNVSFVQNTKKPYDIVAHGDGTWDETFLGTVFQNWPDQTTAQHQADSDNRARCFFISRNCTEVTFTAMTLTGSNSAAYRGTSGYDLNVEAQDAFLFQGCTDCEVGNVTVDGCWGNFVEMAGNGSVATVGMWVHNCNAQNFGRQVFTCSYGGHLIAEFNTLGYSARSWLDAEPNTNSVPGVSGFTMPVQELHILNNTILPHGLELMGLHAGSRRVRVAHNNGSMGSSSVMFGEEIIFENNNDNDNANASNWGCRFGRIAAGDGDNVWGHDAGGRAIRMSDNDVTAHLAAADFTVGTGGPCDDYTSFANTITDTNGQPRSAQVTSGETNPSNFVAFSLPVPAHALRDHGWTLIANVQRPSHLDVGLSPSTSYQYRVEAVTKGGSVSPPSSILTASTLSASPILAVNAGIVAGEVKTFTGHDGKQHSSSSMELFIDVATRRCGSIQVVSSVDGTWTFIESPASNSALQAYNLTPGQFFDQLQQSGFGIGFAIHMVPTDKTNFPLGKCLDTGATGVWDSHWRACADVLIAHGLGDAYIRIGWEMNQQFFQWGASGHEGSFVGYWRHIVNAMMGRSGAAFKFEWAPHIMSAGAATNIGNCYPGDSYVDHMGLDVYPGSQDITFAQMRSGARNGGYGLDWLAKTAQQKGKEIVIPEWGYSSQDNASGASFITNMGKWLTGDASVRPAGFTQPALLAAYFWSGIEVIPATIGGDPTKDPFAAFQAAFPG